MEVSTPTIKGVSRIEKSFEESDQRYFHVPCPLCEGLQKLKFDRLLFEQAGDGRPVNVRYQCIHCEGEFDDSKKDWMLLNGKWIAEKPFAGTAGFHIWEAYSPWRKWEQVVASFLEDKKNPETLKVWVNTCLGETWEEKGEAPEWERLYERREPYGVNTIPDWVYFLTAGADVQKDRIEVEIVGWGRDKQSWSIDYRVIRGDTATEAPWLELDKILAEQWRLQLDQVMGIRMFAIDSGYNAQIVYNWARRYPLNRVIAVKGVETAAVMLGSPSPVDVSLNGRKIRRGFRVWPVCVSMAKSELYAWLKLPKPLDGEQYPPGYCHFPTEYQDGYFKQLTAEQLVKTVVRGFAKFIWKKIGERNEALDCRVYARAAAAAFGMDWFTPSQWDKMKRAVAPTPISIPAAPAPGAASGPQTQKRPERPDRRDSIWRNR